MIAGSALARVFLRPIGQLGAHPDEGEQARLRRTILVAATLLIALAGVVWGLMYLAGGEPRAALIPLGYSILSLGNLAVLWRTRQIKLFRPMQITLTLLLPFLLMIALGGYVAGSAVILWSFLAPLGALMCWDERSAVRWFGAFVAVLALAAVLTPWIGRENNLPELLRRMLFVFNIGGVTVVAFILLVHFVRQKDLALDLARQKRQLERENLQQELMLRQSEKLATLGRLSAGVAHELNNPAAAVRRSAAQLTDAVNLLSECRFRLGQLVRDPTLSERVEGLHARRPGPEHGLVSALERSDRQAEVEASLVAVGVEKPWIYAPTLVDMGLEADVIRSLAGEFTPAQLEPLLGSLISTASAHQLLAEIGTGAGRISEIVNALKTYTYMDQAPVQFLDLTEGLENTLIMLRGKLGPGIAIVREYEANLPPVEAYGGELNQVWTNIIDNALDAMAGEGELRIRSRRLPDAVEIEITDSGPGIPAEVQPHVFEPFYTTKQLGDGTGLGLNITHNIVSKRHGGDIRFESRPGETRFIVRLPVKQSTSDNTGTGHPS